MGPWIKVRSHTSASFPVLPPGGTPCFQFATRPFSTSLEQAGAADAKSLASVRKVAWRSKRFRVGATTRLVVSAKNAANVARGGRTSIKRSGL